MIIVITITISVFFCVCLMREMGRGLESPKELNFLFLCFPISFPIFSLFKIRQRGRDIDNSSSSSITNDHIKTQKIGIANIANTVDIRDLPNTKTPATSLNGKANKGIFRNQARAVANACQNRQDLKKKALARVANLNKLGRVCKATSSA